MVRRRIIDQIVPQLPDGEREKLAERTAGLLYESIVEACHAYLANGALPEPPTLSWCRNPLTGEYCERLFNPFELKTQLEHSGFRSIHLYPKLGTREGLWGYLKRHEVSLFNQLYFRVRGNFVLEAYK